jgi:hypothetical protein
MVYKCDAVGWFRYVDWYGNVTYVTTWMTG